MNQVTLMGRLTKDPELRRTQSGKDVCTFSVACSRAGDGADFISCVAWDKDAVNIHKYFKKGRRILLNGRLSVTSRQMENGENRSFTDVVVTRFEFVENREAEPDMKPAEDDVPLPF